jgi:hypothetical protein
MKSGIIYKGPSLLDGKPIVVIATYSKRNIKTGVVVQTYILVDGINPLEASKTGADFSICGTCAMRGEVTTDPNRKQAKNRRCYVNLGQGVLIVYKSFLRGVYAMADNIADRKSIGRGRFVRVGTYGDPAAVPAAVWEDLLSEADTFTAYSHQSGWRPDIAMQSADNHAQAIMHWQAGRRTFRVIADLGQLDKQNEALCPCVKRGRPARTMYRVQALQRICPCQVHCHSRTLELPAAPSCLGARPPALGPRVGGFLFPSLLHRRARRKAGRKAQDLRIMFQGRKAQGRDARRKALEPRTLSLGQPTTGQGKGLRAPKQKQATGAEGLYQDE